MFDRHLPVARDGSTPVAAHGANCCGVKCIHNEGFTTSRIRWISCAFEFLVYTSSQTLIRRLSADGVYKSAIIILYEANQMRLQFLISLPFTIATVLFFAFPAAAYTNWWDTKLVAFTADTNYMSVSGFVRWRMYQETGLWWTRDEVMKYRADRQ